MQSTLIWSLEPAGWTTVSIPHMHSDPQQPSTFSRVYSARGPPGWHEAFQLSPALLLSCFLALPLCLNLPWQTFCCRVHDPDLKGQPPVLPLRDLLFHGWSERIWRSYNLAGSCKPFTNLSFLLSLSLLSASSPPPGPFQRLEAATKALATSASIFFSPFSFPFSSLDRFFLLPGYLSRASTGWLRYHENVATNCGPDPFPQKPIGHRHLWSQLHTSLHILCKKIRTMVYVYNVYNLYVHQSVACALASLSWMQEVWREYAIRELVRHCEERNARRSMLLGFLRFSQSPVSAGCFFDDVSGRFQPCRAGKQVKRQTVKHVMCPFLLNLS